MSTHTHTPAVMTEGETRAWLHALGLKGVRLPRNLDRVVYVEQPGGGLWRLQALITGGFRVEPYPLPTAEGRT